MLTEYKKKTNIGVGLGILFQSISLIAQGSGGNDELTIGEILGLVGFGLIIWGCVSYARGKGHHGAWGILGIFSIFGFIVLMLFPDRHKETKT